MLVLFFNFSTWIGRSVVPLNYQVHFSCIWNTNYIKRVTLLCTCLDFVLFGPCKMSKICCGKIYRSSVDSGRNSYFLVEPLPGDRSCELRGNVTALGLTPGGGGNIFVYVSSADVLSGWGNTSGWSWYSKLHRKSDETRLRILLDMEPSGPLSITDKFWRQTLPTGATILPLGFSWDRI